MSKSAVVGPMPKSPLQKPTRRRPESTVAVDTAPTGAVALSGGQTSAISRSFDCRYGRSRTGADFFNRLLREKICHPARGLGTIES